MEPTNCDTIIGLRLVCKIVGCSPSTIYRLEKQSKFPTRIRFGANRVGWSLDEVKAWISDRKIDRLAA